ncbi:MAG TPA: heme ABC transporter ATP-binding protein [Candidatus Janibacter merdipullorum]|nr:heme ABC transporter ATP-binding protein [Candidatus Janibacter merdipullorum]
MSRIVLTDVGCTRGGRQILSGVSLEVSPGRLLALVGPNGAGKSTLLALMCGDLRLSGGEVRIDDRPLGQWSASDLARVRSVLLQSNDVSFSFTSREVVEMGRNPWTGRPEADEDEEAVTEAMRTADVVHLADRPYSSLSGGERARVSLARVLAQRTPVVLLDEPTAALDLRHQEEVMSVARSLAREGRAVIVVLHDLSLAAAYADEIAVIAEGTLGALGEPAEVLTTEMVRSVYGVDTHLLESPDGHRIVIPLRHHIATQEEHP